MLGRMITRALRDVLNRLMRDGIDRGVDLWAEREARKRGGDGSGAPAAKKGDKRLQQARAREATKRFHQTRRLMRRFFR